MFQETGSHLLQFDEKNIKKPPYYTFTPTPLMNNLIKLMDDELAMLLIRTHRELGVLEGLSASFPDFEVILNALSLKEACFSYAIDGGNPNLYEMIGRKSLDKSLQNYVEILYHFPFHPCISEYLYKNKFDYFDRFSATQAAGNYLSWVKFFINGINTMCNLTINQIGKAMYLLNEYAKRIESADSKHKQLVEVYLYFKKNLISGIKPIAQKLQISYNATSKVVELLIEMKILKLLNNQTRHRVFGYERLMNCFEIDLRSLKNEG